MSEEIDLNPEEELALERSWKRTTETLDPSDTTGMDAKIKDQVNTEDLQRREADFRAEQELEEANSEELTEEQKAELMMERLDKINDPVQSSWYQALFAVAYDDLGDWLAALEKADNDFKEDPNPPEEDIATAEVGEAVDGSSFSNITGQIDFEDNRKKQPELAGVQEAKTDTQKEVVGRRGANQKDEEQDMGHPDEVRKFDLLASIIGGVFGPHNAIKMLDGEGSHLKEAFGPHHQGIYTDKQGHKYKIEQGKRVPVGDERDKEIQNTQQKQSKDVQQQQPTGPVDSKNPQFVEASKHALAIQAGQLPANEDNFGKFADSAGKMTTSGLTKLKDAVMRNLPSDLVELVTEKKGAIKKALVRFAIAAGVVGVGTAAIVTAKTAGSKVGAAAGSKVGDKLLEVPGGVKKLMQAVSKRYLNMEEKQSTNVPFPPPPARGRWHNESLEEAESVGIDKQGGELPAIEPSKLKTADFVTFPKGIGGANCGNCEYNKKGICNHLDLKGQPVTPHNCCSNWDAPKTLRTWKEIREALEENEEDEKMRLIAKMLVGLYGEEAANFLEKAHEDNLRESYDGYLMEAVEHKSGVFKDKRGRRYKLVNGKRVRIDDNGNLVPKTDDKSAKPGEEQANDINKASAEIRDVLKARHQRKGAAWKKYAISAIAGTAAALLVLSVPQLRTLMMNLSLKSADLLQPVADKITNILRQKKQHTNLEPIYSKSGQISGWWDNEKGEKVPDKE